MAHRSENTNPLEIRNKSLEDWSMLERLDISKPDLCVIHLPTLKALDKEISDNYIKKHLKFWIRKLHKDTVICFICDSYLACRIIESIEYFINFRLWIAVRRDIPIQSTFNLPDNHVSLLVFTKYKTSLKHTKTQIAYSICPACGKTTKDYGGKKHLYSPYGTLLSDVWRDISYKESEYPKDILDRLRDLFGLEPHKRLNYLDCRTLFEFDTERKYKYPDKQINNAGESRLINGDCLEILTTIPDNSIDFIFADPPYNIKKKYDGWNDDQDIQNYFKWCDKWISELARVLKPNRTCAIINIPFWAVRHFSYARKILDFQDWIVWEGLGLPVRQIMPAHYGIICMSKGEPRPLSSNENQSESEAIRSLKEWYCLRRACIKKRNTPFVTDKDALTNLWWDIHRIKHNCKRVDHPCQLPPNLMKRMIYTFTNKGEIVLDPFNGAGTTSLIAESMERAFIGIELSEKYHSLAEQRHMELRKGIDPFRKGKPVPKAKNSRIKRHKKQKYLVPKKTLQLEVKNIALKIGRKPTREDVKTYSNYPIEYFDDYFIDWGEVCGAVGDKGMDENLKAITKNQTIQAQREFEFDIVRK